MSTPTRPPEPPPAISWPEFAAHFDPSVHDTLCRKALEPGTEGLFLLECVDLSSRHVGDKMACQYGPDRTFKAADLYFGRLMSPGSNTLMYSVQALLQRENVEMPKPKPKPKPKPDESVAVESLMEVDFQTDGTPTVLSNVETKREWPKLFKKTAGGKTQEWEIWVTRTPEGHGCIHTKYGLADGKKQEQTDIVTAGKNLGKKNETTPYDQAAAEARAEWTKQLERKGYGRTVEKSAEVRGASPMLAHPVEKVKPADIDWATAHGQPKLDGFRCLATKQGGVVSLRSRENKPIETVPHIAEALQPHLPEGETLDGELYVHGMEFQRIASLVKRNQPDSVLVEYHVYDTILPSPFHARNLAVRAVVRPAGHPRLKVVETVPLADPDALARYQAEQIAAGYEGAMLRHGSAGYEAGKRSKTLLKVKTFKDDEFKVVEVREGRGTHSGMAIFLCVTEAGHHFEVTAPGGHWEKKQYWLNRAACVGAALTVKFFELTAGDAPVPRFPVGLRFKDEPFEMPAEPAAEG